MHEPEYEPDGVFCRSCGWEGYATEMTEDDECPICNSMQIEWWDNGEPIYDY